jgi:hypothetical protein
LAGRRCGERARDVNSATRKPNPQRPVSVVGVATGHKGVDAVERGVPGVHRGSRVGATTSESSMIEPEDRRLVGDLLAVADDLERRGYLGHGLLRAAARRLTEQAATLAAIGPGSTDSMTASSCITCGGPILQAIRGRRRKHCTDCRASRAKSAQIGRSAS